MKIGIVFLSYLIVLLSSPMYLGLERNLNAGFKSVLNAGLLERETVLFLNKFSGNCSEGTISLLFLYYGIKQ